MLEARIANLEMDVYGNGGHGNGLKDCDGTPFGTWQDRRHSTSDEAAADSLLPEAGR